MSGENLSIDRATAERELFRGVSLSPEWLLAAVVTALVCFYWPLLEAGRCLPHGDFENLFLPGQVYAARGLQQGVWPLWNPYHFMGSPFHAGMQTALFYPPHWPLRLFAARPEGALFTLKLSLLLHLVWMGVGIYALARRWLGAHPWAAGVAAFALCYGSFVDNHLPHFNQILSMAWVPWLLLAGHGVATRPGRLNVAGLAASVALGVLVGHPQNIALGLIAMALLLPVWLWESRVGWGESVRRVGLMALAGLLALLLAGVQIVATAELTRQAWIVAQGEGWAESIALPMTKWRELVDPFAFGSYAGGRLAGTEGWMHSEYGVYAGLSVLGMALLGAVAGLWSPLTRRATVGLLLVAAFGALMAVGKATLFFDLVLSIAAPLRKFRAPARYLLLFHTSLALMAALGAEAILRQSLRLLTWATRHGGKNPQVPEAAGQLALAGIALLWLGIHAELHQASRFSAFRHQSPFVAAPTDSRLWRALAEAGAVSTEGDVTGPPERLFWMVRDDHYHLQSMAAPTIRAEQFNPNANIYHGIEMVQGYGESLQPTLRFRDFLLTWHRAFFSPEPDLEIFQAMNAGWAITDIDAPILFGDAETSPSAPVAYQVRGGDFAPLQLYRIPNPLPRLFEEAALPREGMTHIFDGLWVFNGAPIDGMNRQYQPWRDWLPARPPAQVAAARAASRAKVALQRPSFNTLAFSLASTGGQLVLSQAPYPGWVVEDRRGVSYGPLGQDSAILQLLPKQLPEGDYLLRFKPGSFRWGTLMTALGTLILGALLGGALRFRRATPSQPEPLPSAADR